MSELKSFIVLYDGKFIRAYEESEADKVIAHHKRKRCLNMAKACESRSDKLFEDTLSVSDMGLEPSDELTFKLAFFRKWYKRWLELAERFK